MVQSHAAMARLHYIGDTHEGRAMHVLQVEWPSILYLYADTEQPQIFK